MLPLQLAERFFDNAAVFSVTCQTLPRFHSVDALTAETGRWFAALADDDGSAAPLKSSLWRLRATAQLTLLPFDCQELLLREECLGVVNLGKSYPDLAQRRDQLAALVEALVKSAANPKREEVFKRLAECRQKNESVGIVAALTRGRVPGWPIALVNELLASFPDLEILTSKAGLDRSVLDRIILPGGGRLCPFLRELHYCGHASTLELIAYRSEAISIQERPALPSGTIKRESTRQSTRTVMPDEPEPAGVASDAWVEQRFWESARADFGGNLGPNSRDVLIRARLVILSNSWKTFLENDAKILEVSDILFGASGEQQRVQRLPRRKVGDLVAGHLIAMRTTRSGSYLISVADSLMRIAGRTRLRVEALLWKSHLKEALEKHGTAVVAKLLAQRNHPVSNHRYIEIWTTERVIRPDSEALFGDLIGIIGTLGFLPQGSDAVTFAAKHWKQMDELLHYHHVAGNAIRSALLQELRRIIDSGEKVEDEMSISLPGVDAGQLSLYRVTDVDSEVIEVPYTQLEVLRHL